MSQIRIETLGCRLNQIESEATARFFIDNDFSVDMGLISAKIAPDSELKICIINTCAVTQKAEQKARRIIRLVLKKFGNASVIVTGCYAQLASDEICKIDSRICVIGGQVKSRIAQVPLLLKNYINTNEWDPVCFSKLVTSEISSKTTEKKDFPENAFTLSTSSFLSHSRASLKIQDGCNNSCSYCAIHIARGKSVSIPVETAIKRVQELENNGQDEVVITTVNIGQYRGEYKGKYLNFAQLLKVLLEETNKINFRISSLYPEVVTDEFCQIIKDERVCPHFHLSVQSGSDKILQLMNRHYVSADVIVAVEKLRNAKQNPFIACDIITGFPGETKDDFIQTFELCEKCNFSWIHAFPFSERPGTAACSLPNKVPQETSGERAKRLSDWAISNKINYINQFTGKKINAVLETVRRPAVATEKNSKRIYHAVTTNFIHCEIISEKEVPVNKTVEILIQKTLEDRIIKGGEIEASAIFC